MKSFRRFIFEAVQKKAFDELKATKERFQTQGYVEVSQKWLDDTRHRTVFCKGEMVYVDFIDDGKQYVEVLKPLD